MKPIKIIKKELAMPHTRKELLSLAKDVWEKITGKHQQQKEVTVKGWVARDKDLEIHFFYTRPQKRPLDIWSDFEYSICLGKSGFTSVQWSDPEPTPATITIKIEK